MKKRTLGITAGCLFAVLLLVAAGLYLTARSQDILGQVAQTAATKASDSLGVPVEVGDIQVKSLHEIEIRDLAIYDKQAEVIARADEAQVSFRLLSAFQAKELLSQPADAIQAVELTGVEANLSQREDGTWNFEDLSSSSSGETQFHGLVTVHDAIVHAKVPAYGVDTALEQVEATLDFADYPSIRVEATANHEGMPIQAEGRLSEDKKILNVEVADVDLAHYLGYLPEGTLPDGIEICGGRVPKAKATVYKRTGAPLSLMGQAEYENIAVNVLGTEVDNIHGFASFTQKDVLLQTDAEAAGQTVHAHGKVRWDTDTPYLDLDAVSDSFDPSLVLTDIPYRGAAAFTAHITGPVKDPVVEGSVQVANGYVSDIPFADASAKIRFREQHLYVQVLHAALFGGQVSGEAELAADTLAYTGHLRADALDLDAAGVSVPQIAAIGASGRISADAGFSGKGTDLISVRAYGSASMKQGSYQGLPIEDLSTSFDVAGRDVTIDYLSATLPNRTSLGLEGTVKEGQDLDLALYAGHTDLSLLQTLVPDADITGIGDFEGTVQGNIANPQVEFKFSASHGKFFKQPYDSLKITAGGSLDEVHVDDFLLEKDGQQTWFVQGTVGLTGERKIDMRIDTKGARMEDIMALVAPDQPLTGNVDNVIQFTGTLDNPKAVGYVHFYRGSYAGVLLSGMDGDYFIDDGVMRLQDFHLFSPMVDAVLNGTLNKEKQLDMHVKAADLDMSRVQAKMPYPVSGHGTFDGLLDGTIDAPRFHGVLDAPSLVLNGQEVQQIHGFVEYMNDEFAVRNFGFVQNEGTYDMEFSANQATRSIKGTAVVQNADVNAVAAICNFRNDKVQGRLTSGIDVSGTLDNPYAILHGSMEKGTVAGYDVHDVTLQLHLLDRTLYVDQLEAKQGDKGRLSFKGSGSLDGPLEGNLSAQDIALGMFTGLGGVTTEVVGTADIEAALGGYVHNPTIDATIRGKDGGVRGATFDTLTSVLHLKNGQIDIDSLNVQKELNGKSYQLTAGGVVPLSALQVKDPSQANNIEQIMLNISLDNADLSLLPMLSNQVDWAVGATKGNLTITGTAANPQIKGQILVPDGGVKLKLLEKPFTNLRVEADFNGTAMDLKEFSAKMGDGSLQGSGHAELDGLALKNYSLDVKTDKLDIQSDFFRGPLNGEVHIGEGEVFGHKMPKVSGQIDFHDCMVSVPAIPDSDGELPHILLDVQVNVRDKVHFYSSALYDMYLTGQVHFGGTTRHPKTSGSLSVKRGGKVNYLKTVFNITEGAAYFNQVDSFLPSITFHAATRLTQARVYLNLDGPLDAMNISLTSSPEMSQTEIIQLLTLRNAYKAGKQMNAMDILNVGLQMSVLSEVEDVMRKMLWLDDFTLARGSGAILDSHDRESSNEDEDVYNVEMGKYISDKVMIKYTRDFGGGKEMNRVGLQYDMNDHYGFIVGNEDGSGFVGGLMQFKF